jgi:hypothetical protein
MGKSYKKNRRDHEDYEDNSEGTEWIALDQIFLKDATVAKLLARDGQQIERMREQFEDGADMVRVVLHERVSGGYTIEDGRHRVIAARLACVGFVEAIVIGRAGR